MKDRTLTDLATVQLAAFSVTVGGVLGLYAVTMGEMLAFVFTGWLESRASTTSTNSLCSG